MSTILDNSILDDIKKCLGIPIEDPDLGTESYNAFDLDILLFINATFNRIKQLGVGPTENFSISSSDETWGDFFSDTKVVEMVRAYMLLSVKMQFDPPTNSISAEAYKEQINKYEWCMNVDVETNWSEEQ